jgi:hypothetical protein
MAILNAIPVATALISNNMFHTIKWYAKHVVGIAIGIHKLHNQVHLTIPYSHGLIRPWRSWGTND